MKTRTPLIAGNWKMYKTNAEAVETAGRRVELVADTSDVDFMIALVFTAIEPVSKVVAGSRVSLGAHNLYWENEGAYTVEISADMLISAECQYVIIGHSERRQHFDETEQTVIKRIRATVNAQQIPVFCVVETEAERDTGQTFSDFDKQVKKGLGGYRANDLGTLVIAYEPVWAIGTGKTATSDQAQEAHQHIHETNDTLCTEIIGAVKTKISSIIKNLRSKVSVLSKLDCVNNILGNQDGKLNITLFHPIDSKILSKGFTLQFIYSFTGLIIGALCFVFGVVLLFSGTMGSTNWTAEFLGFKSEISGAAPGLVLALMGLFFLLITRFDIKITNKARISNSS